MKRRTHERVLPADPPPELVERTWVRHPTHAARVAAWDQWCEARRAWLSQYGWTEDDLFDAMGMGRPVPASLMAFYEAGWTAPFDPDSI